MCIVSIRMLQRKLLQEDNKLAMKQTKFLAIDSTIHLKKNVLFLICSIKF
jgi:hypothetical protein